jgi:hypothetical protein
MDERAFYDTVVFALSLNARDPDHAACSALVDAGTIRWCIVMSSITRGEATLHEYLNQVEQRCVAQGIVWIEVTQEQVGDALRRSRAVKAVLEQAGMQSKDIKQMGVTLALTPITVLFGGLPAETAPHCAMLPPLPLPGKSRQAVPRRGRSDYRSASSPAPSG